MPLAKALDVGALIDKHFAYNYETAPGARLLISLSENKVRKGVNGFDGLVEQSQGAIATLIDGAKDSAEVVSLLRQRIDENSRTVEKWLNLPQQLDFLP